MTSRPLVNPPSLARSHADNSDLVRLNRGCCICVITTGPAPVPYAVELLRPGTTARAIPRMLSTSGRYFWIGSSSLSLARQCLGLNTTERGQRPFGRSHGPRIARRSCMAGCASSAAPCLGQYCDCDQCVREARKEPQRRFQRPLDFHSEANRTRADAESLQRRRDQLRSWVTLAGLVDSHLWQLHPFSK